MAMISPVLREYLSEKGFVEVPHPTARLMTLNLCIKVDWGVLWDQVYSFPWLPEDIVAEFEDDVYLALDEYHGYIGDPSKPTYKDLEDRYWLEKAKESKTILCVLEGHERELKDFGWCWPLVVSPIEEVEIKDRVCTVFLALVDFSAR